MGLKLGWGLKWIHIREASLKYTWESFQTLGFFLLSKWNFLSTIFFGGGRPKKASFDQLSFYYFISHESETEEQ